MSNEEKKVELGTEEIKQLVDGLFVLLKLLFLKLKDGFQVTDLPSIIFGVAKSDEVKEAFKDMDQVKREFKDLSLPEILDLVQYIMAKLLLLVKK